jgi:hypothetical protein
MRSRELIDSLAAALRDRQAGMLITDAFVGALLKEGFR